MISGELDRDVFDDALSVSVFIILTKIKYQLTLKTENFNQKNQRSKDHKTIDIRSPVKYVLPYLILIKPALGPPKC